MGQVTIISGVERRRVWSDDQKRALVMAVSQPGANVAEIAREADLRPGQIYRWRRQMFGCVFRKNGTFVSLNRGQRFR